MNRERKSWHKTWTIFLVFCCSPNTCLLAGSIFSVGLKPLCRSSFQNVGESNFQPSPHGCVRCSTVVFTSSRLTANQNPFEFLPTNQNPSLICCWYISIFNLGTCYDDLDFGNLPFSISFISPLYIYIYYIYIYIYIYIPFFSTVRWWTSKSR